MLDAVLCGKSEKVMAADQQNNEKKERQSEVSSVMRQLTGQFNNWLKESNPDIHAKVETAMESAAQLGAVGLESAKSTMEMLGEFSQELTGVESFRVIPKKSLAVEVDIHCSSEQDIVVRQQLAPFIELHSLHLGLRINFEALFNKAKKGLQLDINEGMSLRISAPIVGIQSVPIKGSGLLMRNEKGELILAISTTPPGLESPVTVEIPIKHIVGGVKSHLKNKFSER